MDKTNRCVMNPLGIYMCSVDWDSEPDCKYRETETHEQEKCDHFNTWKCGFRLAKVEAARKAANEHLAKCSESYDNVIDCINRITYITMNGTARAELNQNLSGCAESHGMEMDRVSKLISLSMNESRMDKRRQ